MRVEIISAVLFVGLSVVAAYPYPQQNVALPPHLLRQYLAQHQQGRQESAPIYEQESQTSVQPAYAQSQGQQIRNSGVQGLVQKAQAQPQQYVQQYVQQPQYAPQPQQQAYRPKPQLRPRPVPQQQAEEEQHPEDYDPSPNYQFGFDVNDDQFTNYQNRKEERQGDVIKGSYSVVDSDGFIRTVTYTADPIEGFKAEVVRKPTDIVVKVPTPAPATESPLRHQQAQYLEASSPVSRPQQQQYYRPQPQQHAQPQQQQHAQPQYYQQ